MPKIIKPRPLTDQELDLINDPDGNLPEYLLDERIEGLQGSRPYVTMVLSGWVRISVEPE